MRTTLVLVVVVLLVALLVSAATATEVTVLLDNLSLAVQSASGVLALPAGLAVCDQISVQVTPPADLTGPAVLYLDDQPAVFASSPRMELKLDTTQLADGAHSLRVAASLDGAQLASLGEVALQVANATGALQEQVRATVSRPAPPFAKLQRKVIFYEKVWFNNREGDLEHHAIWRHGELYLTATDLFRHLGGTMLWGPRGDDWIEITRGTTTLMFRADTSTAWLNGQARSLGASAVRIGGLTWVPVVGVCDLLGIETLWDAAEGRLYVTF